VRADPRLEQLLLLRFQLEDHRTGHAVLDEIGYPLHAQTRVQATDALISSSRQLKCLYTELAAFNASRRIFSLTGGPTDCSSLQRAIPKRRN
jgi:hypothetical protein